VKWGRFLTCRVAEGMEPPHDVPSRPRHSKTKRRPDWQKEGQRWVVVTRMTRASSNALTAVCPSDGRVAEGKAVSQKARTSVHRPMPGRFPMLWQAEEQAHHEAPRR
jgi:hypothetical protein